MSENLTMTSSQESPETIRRLGGVLIALGALLAGGMAGLMLWINQMLTDSGKPGSTIKLTANPAQKLVISLTLGIVAAFGLSFIFAGIYQITTGRRNPKMIWLFMALSMALVFAARAVQVFF